MWGDGRGGWLSGCMHTRKCAQTNKLVKHLQTSLQQSGLSFLTTNESAWDFLTCDVLMLIKYLVKSFKYIFLGLEVFLQNKRLPSCHTFALAQPQTHEEYRRLFSHVGGNSYLPEIPAAPLNVAVGLFADSVASFVLVFSLILDKSPVLSHVPPSIAIHLSRGQQPKQRETDLPHSGIPNVCKIPCTLLQTDTF